MGILSGRGAYEGSKKESKGYREAMKILEALKPEIDKTHKMMDPWNKYRSGYADQLNAILQGERDWTADPGYQFRVSEDERAVERAAAARGSNISGNVLTELASRRQEMASQEYGNVINRLIGLSAATPENAIAAGNMRANALTQIAMGQAQARIGQGAAEGRGIAAGHAGIEDTLYSLMNYFIPGGNFGSGGNNATGGYLAGVNQMKNVQGTGGGNNMTGVASYSSTMGASQQGYTGSAFSNWASQQGGGGGTTGASSAIGRMF